MLVAELIDQSAKIDAIVIKSRKISAEAFSYNRDLEELRARQRETTNVFIWIPSS